MGGRRERRRESLNSWRGGPVSLGSPLRVCLAGSAASFVSSTPAPAAPLVNGCIGRCPAPSGPATVYTRRRPNRSVPRLTDPTDDPTPHHVLRSCSAPPSRCRPCSAAPRRPRPRRRQPRHPPRPPSCAPGPNRATPAPNSASACCTPSARACRATTRRPRPGTASPPNKARRSPSSTWGGATPRVGRASGPCAGGGLVPKGRRAGRPRRRRSSSAGFWPLATACRKTKRRPRPGIEKPPIRAMPPPGSSSASRW